MITNSKEKDQFQAKQATGSKFPKAASNSSRQWSGFRNPRIVRVSRSFGGKDRHSKVCTIRGLRDRRIRLSVPTAIQLYDLQDRLGLSQPSKVVDWLLDATKTDIDKLPPLQMPQGNFGQFLQQPQLVNEANPPSAHLSSQLAPFFDANSLFMKNNGIKINDNHLEGEDQTLMARSSKHWDFDANLKAKSKEVGGEKWMKANVEENLDGIGGGYNNTQVSAQNFFPPANQSSLPAAGLLNNNSMPYNSYYPWDPSNLSLSQFGSHGFSSQTDQVPHNIGSQLFYCPPSTVAPSLFPTYSPYNVATHHHSLESSSDPRQINHFQLLGSTNSLQNSLMQVPQLHCSPLKSFHVNSKLLPSQNINNGSSTTAEKDNNGS